MNSVEVLRVHVIHVGTTCGRLLAAGSSGQTETKRGASAIKTGSRSTKKITVWFTEHKENNSKTSRTLKDRH